MRRTAAALAAMLFLLVCVPARSAPSAAPTKYLVTIQSLKLKNNTGQWITIVDPDHEVDVASGDARVSFFNKGKVPEGNYINFKVEVSKTVRVSGHDGENKTADGGIEVIGGTAKTGDELPGSITRFEEKAETWNQTSEGDIHAEFHFGAEDHLIEISKKRDFADPLEVKKNSFISVWFILNLENTLNYSAPAMLGGGLPKDNAMIVMPPKKVEELHVTIDDKSVTVNRDDILMEF